MNEYHEDKSPFWAFQLGGWSLLLLITLGGLLYGGNADWREITLSVALVAFGLLYSTLFRYFIRRNSWLAKTPKKLLFPVIVGSLLVGALWTGSFTLLHFLIGDSTGSVSYTLQEYIVTLINNYFIILLWSLIYFAYHYFRIAQIARVERYRTEAAIRDAQLNTLKGQINPHFMFNSLNNIRALMLEDTERSREMLTRLSDLLRYSMTITEEKEVALKEELEVVHDFLELNKVQYEDRLRYSIDMDPSLSEVRIPPMIIQILAENSVKHGIANRPGGGKVEVEVQKKGDSLSIEVRNSGTWNLAPKKGESHGIGLPNIRRRLQIIYGQDATLHLREENEKVIAEINIPYGKE